jgi:hypothetical protein
MSRPVACIITLCMAIAQSRRKAQTAFCALQVGPLITSASGQL